MGKDTSGQPNPYTESVIPDAVKVEIEHHFNKLESKHLDNRAASINRWLSVLGIVFTFFGIVVVVAGYVGYQRFEKIESKAQALVGNFKETYKEALVKLQALDEALEKAKLPSTQVTDANGRKIDEKIAKDLSLREKGDIDKAIEEWKETAKLAKKEADNDLAARAWFFVGYLTREKVLGDPDKEVLQDSIDAYSNAISLNPKYADAYYNRGLAKVELGQYRDAITDYDEAIRLNPNDVSASYNRSKTKQLLGRQDEAKRESESVYDEW